MTEAELEELKKIVAPIAEKRGVDKVYLFGSRARGDNRPDSDYDFIISRGKLRGLAFLGL
ncbi:MAG: nucleotidyltransferase domain-containing protein, partial [Synergistaceae bacterium]|nr:nucleotidyltransferase domain-containing protein [Synergistaceae bacterium]MBR0222123.1 nucleotidyltransferase domain-containing protein [Synergistaceae bacterium]